MFKVEIELDKDKILRENKYNYKKMCDTLDKAFLQVGIPNISKNEETKLYSATGENDEFGRYWAIMVKLEREEWFTENVKKWLWYNESDINSSKHHIDNLLEQFEKEKKYGRKTYKVI